jgi:hypothetical protein
MQEAPTTLRALERSSPPRLQPSVTPMMTKRSFRPLLVSLYAALSVEGAAAQTPSPPRELLVNLAELTPGGTTTRSIEPGRYRVRVINQAPKFTYDVSVQRVRRAMEQVKVDVPGGVHRFTEPAECTTLRTVSSTLDTVTSERDVPAAKIAVERALAAAETCDPTLLASVKAQLEKTEQTTQEDFEVRRQEDLQVHVRRSDGREFARIFRVDAAGEWRPTFGLAFAGSRAEAYQTVQAADGSGFTITRQRDRHDWDYVPAVFYGFVPARATAVALSPTIGLGYFREKPAVLGGVLLTYWENIGISAGFGYLSEPMLSGAYRSGAVVKDVLNDDQLHDDEYKLTWFLSLTLRSLTAPFKPQENTTREPSGNP